MTLSGQTKRGDMTSGNLDLFKMALGLEDPWKVTRTDFNPEGGRLDLYLDFPRGARFSCPVDGCGQKACPVHDAEDKQWRHLDFFQHEAYMHARLPRVRCDEHGVHQVNVSWARPGSGFTLLFEALLITFATVRVTFHGSSSPNAILNRSRLPAVMSAPLRLTTECHDGMGNEGRSGGPQVPKSTRSSEEPFFCSVDYDLGDLASEMNRQFDGVRVVGCTTAGEVGPAGYRDRSLVGASFPAGEFTATTGRLDELRHFEFTQASDLVHDLRHRLEQVAAQADSTNTFALLLIDGLCLR